MSHHVENDEEATHTCFKNSSDTITKLLQSIQTNVSETHPDLPTFVVNQSQWNRLQRQALPLQLQVTWLSYFKESIAQRYHMCCLLRRPQGKQCDIALATLHSAEQITFDIFLAARGILLHNQYLRDKQKEYADIIYQDALDNLIQFRNQSLIADAEFALSQTLPSVTKILVAIVERSIAKHSQHIDEAVARIMLQRCQELTDIVSNTPFDGVTEAECMQWRASLPLHQFRLI